ncbi:uncharacterized protein [Triticum aestivum]|uniref:uncharacterized protein n=1 Tax=Triticum aestivum TaxID=4565 RepID=UPI001D01E2C5|nr:uncharacterized protein LOC123168327 [Triticum aestivum]
MGRTTRALFDQGEASGCAGGSGSCTMEEAVRQLIEEGIAAAAASAGGCLVVALIGGAVRLLQSINERRGISLSMEHRLVDFLDGIIFLSLSLLVPGQHMAQNNDWPRQANGEWLHLRHVTDGGTAAMHERYGGNGGRFT